MKPTMRKSYVDPEEIIERNKFIPLESIFKGNEVMEAVYEYLSSDEPEDKEFNTLLIIGSVFEAGRIQGIREERAKRK